MERAVLPVLLPLLKMAPGCFLFCTRQAYLAAGGFNETLAWSEEVAFATGSSGRAGLSSSASP